MAGTLVPPPAVVTFVTLLTNQILLPLHFNFCLTTPKNVQSDITASGSFLSVRRIATTSPNFRRDGSRPSTARKTGSSGSVTSISINDSSRTMTDRLVRTCGQIGVITNTPDSGAMIGPPADKE